MAKHNIVLQKEYITLEDFIREQNNFYLHFLNDCYVGNEVYRSRLHFKRFQKQYSEMEQDITNVIVKIVRAEFKQELPYKQLWEAYKIMSKLVFADDIYVMCNKQPDNLFLCR